MAKQIGEYRFEGTIDGICFYKMEGNYYARKQTSLTGKRFWKAACFAASRRSCKRLSLGSQLAAMVYITFQKQKGMYAALKSRAIALLKKDTSEVKVIQKLHKLAQQLQPSNRYISKYIRPLQTKKSKKQTQALVISLPALNETNYNFNSYLSSA